MKTIAIACNIALGGLMLITSHWVIAQVENAKLIEDEQLVSTPVSAQQFAEEQAIRTLVERQNRGEQVINGTDEFVGSGAAPTYPVATRRPSTGTLEVSERAGLEQPAPAMHERIVRLLVAQSGELAYEYGDYAFGSAAPEVEAQSFDGSYLRVWRKQNGEWLVDAAFARP